MPVLHHLSCKRFQYLLFAPLQLVTPYAGGGDARIEGDF
jgi:hypothetical protein